MLVGTLFGGGYQPRVGNFSYTSAGAVGAMQLGNGKWENTVFNSRLQPVQIGLGNSQNTQDLWKVNYDYGTTDNNGNVKGQTITVQGQFTAVQSYTYDSLNRLKQAAETIGGNQTWKQTFLFDRYGNRTFDASQTTTLGNCPQNVCNPSINSANNRVVGHSFDNAGNTTIDAEGRQFFYNGENKQKEVRDAQNNIIGQYLYDGDGKRVKKLSANDTTIFVYDAAGKLASEYLITALQSQAPTTSYLTNDTLGSPRVTTDSSGNVVSRKDFRPFGEEIYRPNQGTDSLREKFATYERDNETELDFAQARFYDSKLGRFNSVDPLMASADIINPQTFNRYVYVGNNPLNEIDPTGEVWGEKNGELIWYPDNIAMAGAGAVAATQLVGWIGNQLVALNPNSNIPVPVASAALAIQHLVTWGVGEGLIAGSLSALGVGAVAAGAIAANIACGAPCTNLYQANSGYAGNSARDYANMGRWLYGDAAPKTIFDYVDSQGNLLPQYLISESISEENAEQSANAENNKPDTSANTNGNANGNPPREPQGTVKMLSKGEIKKLEKAGHDIHELKGGRGAAKLFDLFKDQKGNIFVARKGGKGEFDPTGLNINDF